MKRTRQEAMETRERILDCAEIAFSAKGVTHTALEDIATAAGVTRGAIYGHFKNKSDIFDAMVSRVKLPLQADAEATGDPEAKDPLGLIRELLAKCLRDAATDLHAHRVFDVLYTKCEYSSEMGSLLERTIEAGRQGRARLARGLRNAQRKSQLPLDLDTKRAAAMLNALIGGVLRDWLLDRNEIALPKDAERIVDAALDMLRFSPSLRKPAPRQA